LKRSKTIITFVTLLSVVSILGLRHVDAALILPKNHASQNYSKVGKSAGQYKYLSGGLIKTIYPNVPVESEIASDTSTSLGSSGTVTNYRGILKHQTQIVSATSLPQLWNPLNTNSKNYNQLTPVLNQKDLGICWDYSGIDSIGLSSQVQKITVKAPPLLPAYYDYLSAQNAFIDTDNPLAVMEDAYTPRQLGDGNTLDYVPSMSVLGYDPRLANAQFPQEITQSQDIPISKTSFDTLQNSNLHVNDTYKLTGMTVSQLPTNYSTLMNRVTQIKQLIYSYGSVLYGPEVEYALDSDWYDTKAQSLSEQVDINGNYTSYTPYSAVLGTNKNYQNSPLNYPALTLTWNGQKYITGDHEMEIVGYDDGYSANNFKQTPTIGGQSVNGAFIVKNSWGTDYQNSGYFYLSYADLFIAGSDLYGESVGVTQSNQKIYSATNTSPDAAGYYLDFGYSGINPSNNNLFSNTYTSQSTSSTQVEQLNSVSIMIEQPGVKVNIYYKSGGVSSSTKVSDFTNLGSYTFTTAGYQTIPFKAVTLSNHSKYTIAFRITNMTSFSDLTLPIQHLESANSGQYPVLTTENSWAELDNSWENLSSNETDEGVNLYLDANTQLTSADTVTFNSNGGTTVASQKVAAGDTVNLPTNPIKESYVLAPLADKHYGVPFKDTVSNPFLSDITWIYDEGITTGTSATTYSPSQSVTRGQMAAFMYRMVSSPKFVGWYIDVACTQIFDAKQSINSNITLYAKWTEGSAVFVPTTSELNKFKDISSSTFKTQILWLLQMGITTGTSATTYSPNSSVTRAQMATFLHRLAIKMNVAPQSGKYSNPFKDVKSFSNDIGWLKSTGITTGTSPTTYSPNAHVTREQMAAFLHRFYKKFVS